MPKFLKLPPELADGEHWTLHGLGERYSRDQLGEALERFMCSAEVGESVTLTIVVLPQDYVDALPDI